MVEVFANCEDPDQTPRSVASDLGLHCLPVTLLGVSRLQWANVTENISSWEDCVGVRLKWASIVRECMSINVRKNTFRRERPAKTDHA